MQNRQSYRRKVNHMYSYLYNNGVCVYCGAPATTEDHFVPLSVAAAMVEVGQFPNGALVIVPACMECNSLAGAKVFRSIGSKRRYIHERIEVKHWEALAMPEWNEQELAEIGATMREYVLAGLREKEYTLRRLSWRNRDNSANVSTVRQNLRLDVMSVRRKESFARQDVGSSLRTRKREKFLNGLDSHKTASELGL